jgi:hypothetical protein
LVNYTQSETDVDCLSSGISGHNLWTKEYAGAAFAEAVADFMPTITYNFTFETNGAFGHHQVGSVDVENGSVSWPLAFMKTKCNPGSLGIASMGVELDWLRQLWDVRTNGGATLNEMLDWMDNQGSGMTPQNVYSKLETASNSVGGAIDANWDTEKSNNGIDP